MTLQEARSLPEGTKVVVKDRRNADGTWIVTERYLLFPDGTTRDLFTANCNSEQSKSNADLSGAI